ncbi:hypothetical protein [Soonwooa sp.]|uniref:hypothetical protein n=1 Tax=Soonwooa sp. TaxID=1938592 RepID=UPI0028B22FD8|nr:hypothetical protein [Soonwooa sp.]
MASLKIKIKPEFKDKVIGYNGRSLPLSKRRDLDVLARLALESQSKELLPLFEEIPTLEELNKQKTNKVLEDLKP